MEFSKDSDIINILNSSLTLLTNNNTFEIIINNYNNLNWSELEFNNFTSSISNNDGIIEMIDDEILEILDDNDNALIIYNMSNIIKYCNNESLENINSYKFLNKKKNLSNKLDNLFDYNILFNINETNELSSLPDNWNTVKKKYTIYKKIKYVDKINDIEYVTTLIKKNKEDDTFENFKSSNIIKELQNYQFSIIIKNSIDISKILESIVKMLQYITLYPNIMFKEDQKKILLEYNDLIKKDIRISSYNKKDFIPLLTPKPITLEKINLIDPKEFGAVSILDGYTVTEKADGERLLLYINNNGNIYTINNTYNIFDTGLVAQSNLYNSLIDGEYVTCDKRIDNSTKHLFAAFDMFYIKGKNITSLPLIAEKENNSRYNYLKFAKNNIDSSKSTIEFTVKNFYYNDDKKNILNYCGDILTNYKSYPYEIDGLIFTPSKLPLYSYYSNKPVQLTDNVRWDRLFKWKPPEQNTIDFLVKYGKIIRENGQKYRELKLYVGYNSNQWEDIGPNKGLKLRYDHKFAKEQRYSYTLYKPVLFKPNIYFTTGVEIAYVKINSKDEIRTDDNQIIEDNSIIEFNYNNNINISVHHRWNPLRIRDDKTRLFKKGEISKTMNDLNIAINIWRSIHNSVTNAMIMGNEDLYINNTYNENSIDKVLDSDDVYYSRNIPRESLLSVHMLNFHNQCIKKKLYEFSSNRSSLLELCGGEGGDMNRWLEYNYSFILSIDLVKQNIYNPRSGGYSRLIKKKNQSRKMNDKVYFPDIVFAVGDCSIPINTGECAKIVGDEESENILKIVMNKHRNNQHHLRHIAGKGSDKFAVCSCQFAIHYFFENEEKLNGFLSNVTNNLKKDGIFFATFMDGNSVITELQNSDNNIIKGIKHLNHDDDAITWAIIRKFDLNTTNKYGRQIGVFIENTQKIIPEYLVDLDLLIKKAKEYNLEFVESNTFEKDFNIIKDTITDTANLSRIQNDIIELDKDEVQKKFSFLNRYIIFKKI